MGMSIDLYSYDYEKLKNKTLDYCKTDNVELVEKILSSCGSKIADRYIILNQECWEDSSCFYNVSRTLDRVFKVEDSFGEIFCTYVNGNILDKVELVRAMDIYDISETIGIEIPYKEY